MTLPMVRFEVKVVPGARRTEVCGTHATAIKIRLQAPPVEGRANEALIRFLAERLQLSPSAVRLLRGHTSPHKIVEVVGITPTELQSRLGLVEPVTFSASSSQHKR